MKRMSPRPMSPKMLSWNKKLAMWRKNHRRADGSLPSLKSAMKACKGRRVSTKKCRRRKSFRKHRKAPGQYSPKKASPKNMSPVQKKQSPAVQKKQQAPSLLSGLFGSAQKKQQSPAAQKKPAVFGQKAPANPMFVPGAVKKQQKPAQKKQQSPAKQQKPAQKKQQSPAAQKKQQKPAQRKPQFGQKAQAKPAPALRFT